MTITEVTESLSAKADRHLWGHFARHGAGITPPTITRGEGVTIWDDKGKSYIDGDYHAWPRGACLIGQIGLGPALLDCAGFRSADWSYRERDQRNRARGISCAAGSDQRPRDYAFCDRKTG